MEVLGDAATSKTANFITLLQKQQKTSKEVERDEEIEKNISRDHCRNKSSKKRAEVFSDAEAMHIVKSNQFSRKFMIPTMLQ